MWKLTFLKRKLKFFSSILNAYERKGKGLNLKWRIEIETITEDTRIGWLYTWQWFSKDYNLKKLIYLTSYFGLENKKFLVARFAVFRYCKKFFKNLFFWTKFVLNLKRQIDHESSIITAKNYSINLTWFQWKILIFRQINWNISPLIQKQK